MPFPKMCAFNNFWLILGATTGTASAAKPNAICGGAGGVATATAAAPASKTVCCKNILTYVYTN